ncbi:MAG: DUF2505 domain-containing protein [Halioglobus sp.]
MPVHHEFEHDADSVFSLLTDPDFLVDRCLGLGELEASCEVDQKAGVTEVTLTRKLERELPGFIAKIMSPVQTMHMTEHWRSEGDGSWSGDLTFEMEGQPIRISGEFELYPTDAGCCYSIEHTVKANIPLIGRKLEKYVLGQAQEGCVDELAYLQEHLD